MRSQFMKYLDLCGYLKNSPKSPFIKGGLFRQKWFPPFEKGGVKGDLDGIDKTTYPTNSTGPNILKELFQHLVVYQLFVKTLAQNLHRPEIFLAKGKQINAVCFFID